MLSQFMPKAYTYSDCHSCSLFLLCTRPYVWINEIDYEQTIITLDRHATAIASYPQRSV